MYSAGKIEDEGKDVYVRTGVDWVSAGFDHTGMNRPTVSNLLRILN